MQDTVETQWISVSQMLPQYDQIVETKIDDSFGARNEQDLKLKSGLWWLADGSMYIYYSPTHWRPKTNKH